MKIGANDHFDVLNVWRQIFLISVLLCVVMFPRVAPANWEETGLKDNLVPWITLLDRAQERLQNPDYLEGNSDLTRFQLEFILSEVSLEKTKVEADYQKVLALLSLLQGSEGNQDARVDPVLNQEFQKYTRQEQVLKDYLQQLNFIQFRASNILAELNTKKHAQRWKRLIQQNPVPLLPSTWQEASPKLFENIRILFLGPLSWAFEGEWQNRFLENSFFVISSYGVIVFIGFGVSSLLLRRFPYPEIDKPTFQQRLGLGLLHWMGRSLRPVALFIGGAVVLLATGIIDLDESPVFITGITNFVFVILSFLSALVFLRPASKQWRLIEMRDELTLKLKVIIFVLSVNLALSGLFGVLSAQAEYDPALDTVLTFIFGTVLAGTLMAFFAVIDVLPVS